MNSDGTLMVFSSDRPGGLGGSDIYYSQLVDGQWSEPVNLGPEINTQGDELFPYLFSDSILYFSSNGHYGLGGLDVYQSVFDEEKSHSIKNMGVPINSNADDFGFIIHERGTMGYFSSNRESYENDDIYRFRILPIGVSIQLVDAGTGKSLSNGNISIAQENASEMLTYSGDPLRYLVDYNTSYTIEASAGGYQPGHYTFDAEALEPGQLKEIAIKMKSLKAPEPEPQPAQVIVPADVAEVVEIGNKTYIGVDGELFSPEDMNISMDSLKTMKENRGDTAESIEIENIYYEHNKFDLKTQARKTIHGIVLLMEKYKSAILEIASHTDSKGSKSYNERLAQDRSNRVVEYLDSLGVDKNRLRATSYGETRLLNNCSDGVPCTPAEHRMNRRTEFVLKLE
jgi:outer membrane protein OmpA-like peptidoglycan-associated protein